MCYGVPRRAHHANDLSVDGYHGNHPGYITDWSNTGNEEQSGQGEEEEFLQ